MTKRRSILALATLLLAVGTARAADQLVAVLAPTQGNTARGIIAFRPEGDGVRVTGIVTGLTPSGKHGFHVHQYGDCTAPDATSAGDHYSPAPTEHGDPTKPPHHAGDLGNIEADDKGSAVVNVLVKGVSTTGDTAPLVGRGLIVHGKADDLTSQPSGNAGPRVACGVLGVTKTTPPTP
ncbi:MAG TPA: superoxide dismutase family protein [Candidatus Binatia bacterium]|jgi:Cu-Zn family superoxide dismutase|nr:superoxide dismutase family protein [Candidatus Binatia bacterium]